MRKSSSRCSRGPTLAFWVLSKLPMCIHNSIYAQLKAWANSFIIERQQGSARRSFLLKILTTHKKINKRPYWLVENTPYFILWFEREHLIQLTDNCEWKLSSKFTGKIKKIKAKWTQVSLKNVLKVKDPKLSRVLIVQNNLYAFSFIFQREGKLHCSLTGRKLWSQAKKKCSRHLIYARACVNKDFVHSGSLRLI